ncbi:MAG: alpha/beta hydrolase [Proteobacteria bacterium]|nr:alpha/beta hydrolase [Pseudomonadota bacterium]
MPTLKLKDLELRYLQHGTGPDIVWLPGGDEVAEAWDNQFETFGPSFRNTSMDPRGAGQTVVHKRPPWTIEDMADDCADLVRARCKPPVVLIGLSMGSLITLQFAIKYPELVRLAIPMGTAAKATGFSRDWMIAEVEFRKSGGRLPPDFAVTHYAAFSYPSEVLGDDALWQKIRDRVGVNYGHRDGDLLTAQWQACIDFDVVDQLPGCRVPIDVIGFSEDCQCPAPMGQRVAKLAPNARFHMLQGLGHVSCEIHKPEVVNNKIWEILRHHNIA